MTKYVLTNDVMMEKIKSEAEGNSLFPDGTRLIENSQVLSLAETDSSSSTPHAARQKRFSAAQAAAAAGKQLVELVHLPLDSVSAVTRSEVGWQVVVNLVELSRIPHSIDVISSYSVSIGEDGDLESYRRIARYTRDQLGEDA